MMECVEEYFGVDEEVFSFVFFIGVIVNMDGMSFY